MVTVKHNPVRQLIRDLLQQWAHTANPPLPNSTYFAGFSGHFNALPARKFVEVLDRSIYTVAPEGHFPETIRMWEAALHGYITF